jgi:tetratricopeptide (TPR) repeat protein
MDSQHRHELKTNELAEGLSHLPQLLKDNASFIIGVLLIGAALITWPMFNKMSQQKDRTEQTAITQSIQMLDRDVYAVLQAPADDAPAQTEALSTLLVNADALLGSVSDIDNPNLAAMAQIKAAQAIRTELHLRKEVDADMLERQIKKSEDAYQKAFEAAETSTIKAMAQFGLALCSEELGQIEQAADIYRQIVGDESYKATVLPTQAQHRLDTLADNTEVFNFAAVPVVIEEPVEVEEIVEAITAETTDSADEPTVEEAAETDDADQPVEGTTKPQAEKQ